ncbi:hypothetical protein M378DRAFT_168624 [Amanita muscaria Koide BX008]|uniref:Uncharacterized protein n=1 Tax=Amanita muscaria (strain Koide BX008) TaxID=946122 RepID=A0A0C2WUJ5_AMAMK|nr:hypothetical protein M378DRAFT_168624 [Amanita muscaria Koide BX008]
MATGYSRHRRKTDTGAECEDGQVVFLHLSRTMIKGVPYGGREKPQTTMTLTGLLFSPRLFGMSCQFNLSKS